MASWSNSRSENRKERPNLSINNEDMVHRLKHYVICKIEWICEWHPSQREADLMINVTLSVSNIEVREKLSF